MTSGSTAFDPARLRADRLARLQGAMRARGVEACVLCHDPNVRYATGASAMPVWSMSTFARCAVVAQDGAPILFEHAGSVHRSRRLVGDVRPMHAWEFFDDQRTEAGAWAREVLAAVRELGHDGRRIATDRLAAPAFAALTELGIEVTDASPVTMAARERKTLDEIEILRANGRIVVDMLGAVERAIRPGVRERELLAVLAERLVARGGEYLATNTVCSGSNTNPWCAEATERSLESGELVFVDTDCVGIEGYFSCVSRTFPCGPQPPEHRGTYAAALEWLEGMRAILRPGVTMAEIARTGPPIPDRYLPQRYECLIHGIGLEEESPSACHPDDPQPNPDRVIEEGMALVVECYMGEIGRRHGVKLGDQVVIGPGGAEVVAPYPFVASLAGGSAATAAQG